MKQVTKEEFFKIVENSKYHLIIVDEIPVSNYVDENDNLVGKAIWSYPETQYVTQ